MPAVHNSWEKLGGGYRGECWSRPFRATVSWGHHVLMLKIKNQMRQKSKRQWKLGVRDNVLLADISGWSWSTKTVSSLEFHTNIIKNIIYIKNNIHFNPMLLFFIQSPIRWWTFSYIYTIVSLTFYRVNHTLVVHIRDIWLFVSPVNKYFSRECHLFLHCACMHANANILLFSSSACSCVERLQLCFQCLCFPWIELMSLH